MKRLILHLGHPACDRCPHCTSRLPQAGFVVSDSASVTQFVCHAHLAELAEVCTLEQTDSNPTPQRSGKDLNDAFR